MPDTSTTTIERTLKSLLDSGTIIKIGAGRSTRYVKRR
jgi:predicted HTH transcriptional regulator